MPLVAALGVVAAACGSSPSPTPTSSAAPSSAATLIRVLDETPDQLGVQTGPSDAAVTVACKQSVDVPSAPVTGPLHLLVHRPAGGAVVFDRVFAQGSRSAVVIRQSGTAVLPLEAPSYGPGYDGPCATGTG